MNIGERIKALRIAKSWTQKELAKQSVISENAIKQYENGKRQPKVAYLAKIAEALDVSLDYLLGNESNGNPTSSDIDLGSKLKKLRQKLNVPIDEIVEKTNIPKVTYMSYEINSNDIDLSILDKLATFFNVPLNELLPLVNLKHSFSYQLLNIITKFILFDLAQLSSTTDIPLSTLELLQAQPLNNLNIAYQKKLIAYISNTMPLALLNIFDLYNAYDIYHLHDKEDPSKDVLIYLGECVRSHGLNLLKSPRLDLSLDYLYTLIHFYSHQYNVPVDILLMNRIKKEIESTVKYILFQESQLD